MNQFKQMDAQANPNAGKTKYVLHFSYIDTLKFL